MANETPRCLTVTISAAYEAGGSTRMDQAGSTLVQAVPHTGQAARSHRR